MIIRTWTPIQNATIFKRRAIIVETISPLFLGFKFSSSELCDSSFILPGRRNSFAGYFTRFSSLSKADEQQKGTRVKPNTSHLAVLLKTESGITCVHSSVFARCRWWSKFSVVYNFSLSTTLKNNTQSAVYHTILRRFHNEIFLFMFMDFIFMVPHIADLY